MTPRFNDAPGLLSLLLFLFVDTVLFEVFINPARRVYKLLLAGVEGMTGRTYVELVIAPG